MVVIKLSWLARWQQYKVMFINKIDVIYLSEDLVETG